MFNALYSRIGQLKSKTEPHRNVIVALRQQRKKIVVWRYIYCIFGTEAWQEQYNIMKIFRKRRGYTLIELVVVMALIAIVAAITVPKLSTVRDRTELSDTVSLFQRTIADAKSLAMKNRRAVTIEIRPDKMWVNVLSGMSCDDAIAKRCFHTGESGGRDTTAINLMCDLRSASVVSNACTVNANELSGGGLGICYNGSGHMWIRTGEDTNAACAAVAGASPNPWLRACAPWIGANAATNATQSTWFSGVDARFNRGVSACPAGSATPSAAQDVTRRVIVPAGGHPYIKLVESAND